MNLLFCLSLNSGGHGTRTHNRLLGTKVPVWLLSNLRTLQGPVFDSTGLFFYFLSSPVDCTNAHRNGVWVRQLGELIRFCVLSLLAISVPVRLLCQKLAKGCQKPAFQLHRNDSLSANRCVDQLFGEIAGEPAGESWPQLWIQVRMPWYRNSSDS